MPPIVHEVLRLPGQPLESETRDLMEQRFGHDFSSVSVHSTGQGMIQTKLKINEPGDIYEQEADLVADAVMRTVESEVQRQVKGNVPTFALANSFRLHPRHTCGNYTDVVSP